MPRPSSPLSAKASVRSPYALDRSQQNPCVGTVCMIEVRNPTTRPHMRFVFARQYNDVFSGTPENGIPFHSRCHLSSPGGLASPEGKLGSFRSRTISKIGEPRRFWWSQTGSNRRPHACKARALPTELWPRSLACRLSIVRSPRGPPKEWWAQADSNRRPHAYQACALTS